jgi:hypothetical protein
VSLIKLHPPRRKITLTEFANRIIWDPFNASAYESLLSGLFTVIHINNGNMFRLSLGSSSKVCKETTDRYVLHLVSCFFSFFFFFNEGPSHHSLKAFCVIPMKMKMSSFLPSFTSNGAPVEWNRQGKTDNSEKNLSQCHFVHHKSHMDLTWDRTPGLRGERPATNRLSHGTASSVVLVSVRIWNYLCVKFFFV